MSTLTFEQHAARDRFVTSILYTVAVRIKDNKEVNIWDVTYWDNWAIELGLSKEAISQTVEEVRQILQLMEKLNKKRVA